MKSLKINTKNIVAVLSLIAIIIVFACMFVYTRPFTHDGSKEIYVQVIHGSGEAKSFDINTNAEYLGEALVECKELKIEGTNGEFGLFITSVDGEAASDENHTYWCISKDSEPLSVGADSQPIEDKEHYELTLTTW